MKRILIVLFCALPLLSFSPSNSHAAGFAILEQSAEGIGYAYAGAAAGYGDGSEIAYNPAAMSWLPETIISHSSHLIITSAEFNNEGSSNPMLGGVPLGGSNGPDGGDVNFVPSLYIAGEFFEDVHIGLGVHAPFGLRTDYDREWVGRYHAVTSELKTIQITPAISRKLTDNFSLGASLNAMYAEATLSNAIDFGTIGVGALGPMGAAAAGLAPQMNDGYASVNGNDWGFGFTVGGSYKYGDDSKVGVSWKTQTPIDLKGDADFEVPTAALPLTATGRFVDQTAGASIDLPENVTGSWIHNFSDEFGLLAEVQWTGWSNFEELRIRYDGAQPDTVQDESWDDVWRYSVAVRYSPTEKLDLSLGYTFDEEPIPDTARRTPRIPGNDRNWLAVGLKYRADDDLVFKATYAHLFISDADVSLPDATGNTLVGSFDNAVDLVGVGVDYTFGGAAS